MHQGHSKSFFEILKEADYVVVDKMEDADIFLSIDLKKDDIHLAQRSGIKREKCILIRNEPEIVWPLNYKKIAQKYFGVIVDLDRLPDGSSITLGHPQFWPAQMGMKELQFRNQCKAVFMFSNKLSFVKGELYSFRRTCLVKIDRLDHYGNSWDLSLSKRIKILIGTLRIEITAGNHRFKYGAKYWFLNWPRWLGPVHDKYGKYQDYKVGLIIENSIDALTEKIFDSFFNCTIPVYVGPNLDSWKIPQELAIQVRPDIGDVQTGINYAMNIDYEKWRSDLIYWLDKEETRNRWSSEFVFRRLFKIIDSVAQA